MRKEISKEYLEGLKVGDKVLFDFGTGWEEVHLKAGTVVKITAKNILVKVGTSPWTPHFDRETGEGAKASRSSARTTLRLVEPTPAAIAEYKDTQARRKALAAIRQQKWEDLSTDQLRAVLAIIEPADEAGEGDES